MTCRALVLLIAGMCMGVLAKEDKCTTCKNIAKKFDEEFKKTERSNFGGGNTAWEERSLGTYATSETRFLEIIEHVCNGKNYECAAMIEEAEEHLETFWTDVHQKKLDFFEYICIMKLKVCCQSGKFGKDCKPCPGGAKSPCSGNGKCEGEGQRSGKGKCTCNVGYEGKKCEYCKTGYFLGGSVNSSALVCVGCDSACHNCTGPGPQHCSQCKTGFEFDNSNTCVDIDECGRGLITCVVGEFCQNSIGSHSCEKCHQGCSAEGCSGPGADKCVSCATGFERKDGLPHCIDINECLNANVCAVGQYCLNTQGSMSCMTCDESCSSDGCRFGGPNGCHKCAAGYQQSEKNKACEDIDECSIPDPTRCEPGFSCKNNKGGFSCECEAPNTLLDGACSPPPTPKVRATPTPNVVNDSPVPVEGEPSAQPNASDPPQPGSTPQPTQPKDEL